MKQLIWNALLLLVVGHWGVVQAQTTDRPYRWSKTIELMASPFQMVVYAPDTMGLTQKVNSEIVELQKVIHVINYFHPDSEVNRWSKAQAGGRWLYVSPELRELLKYAKKAYRISDGQFDVSIGKIIQFWKENPIHIRPPSPDNIKSKLPSLRLDQMKFFGPWVKWGAKRAQMDFGGIGKGYIVDILFDRMKKLGYEVVLINAGGDLRVGHSKPNGGWRIGVEWPDSIDYTTSAIELVHRAVATSGATYQKISIGEEYYSHLIHPQSGFPIARLSNVTVIANTALEADFYASYFSILDPDIALKMANQREDIALLITWEEDDILKSKQSADFSNYLRGNNSD